MMEYTDRHFRHMCRLISPRMELWSEMVTANAIVNTKEDEEYQRRFLQQSALENPTILQLGGSDPSSLAEAVKIACDSQSWSGSWNGINLNCGCPSDKVSLKGCFGARLMESPTLVSECVSSMSNAVSSLPPSTPKPEISVKCRIGVDSNDSYSDLTNFIESVTANSPVKTFQIHARKAVLDGTFSPVDNRTIPPLKYEYVYGLCRDYPDLEFHLNGGVMSLTQVREVYEGSEEKLKGVMVGRSIVSQPWYWSNLDYVLYGEVPSNGVESRRDLVLKYAEHAEEEEKIEGVKARRRLIRPLVNLFNGEEGGKKWRQKCDEIMQSAGSKRKGYADRDGDHGSLTELLTEALKVMPEEAVERSRLDTFELMLLKEKIIKEQGVEGGGGGIDKVARQAKAVWEAERKERERIMKEEDYGHEDEALQKIG
ncbi:hypothetical protein TrST_g11048 [Triparma strigata]|uniref:DUS-like FMN-binding domain-containing protein n=1 Tax=Triparma strigata TaxID=1606541 RepID=A0A9W7DSE2_9STRA|nr:hypothetical protein TrST_g11048 [Triparma strigata]